MRKGAKRITREQILGETAVQFIGRRFLDMGFPWHPSNAPLDAGIDGFVEIRDVQSGEATNAWIAVQSKGRTILEKETDATFEFTCTPRDLDYWRRGNMPVLLVVSRPERNEAWWVSVKDYFRNQPSRQQSRRIVFDKKANSLTSDAAGQLLQLVQAAGAGTYFRPAPKREQLQTNLLEVKRFPQLIYWAQTSLRDPAEFREQLRKQMQYPPREWVFNSKRIYSVHDLRDEPWASVSEIDTVDWIEGRKWASSDDPQEQRLFVWILNECLRSFAGKIGMRYSKEDDALYFKKTPDLSPRVKRYRSRQQWAQRDVFREYRSKTDPSKIFYYRHVGFEPRFRRFDGRWCLEINPTYLFTSDGENTHAYNEEYLAKIKSIEGSGAVGGSVVMFASLLRDREGLFADNYPHLGFGNLLEGELDVGIDDKFWSKDDKKRRAEQPVEEAVELNDAELASRLPMLFDDLEDNEDDA
ncbi:MAG: DUF4365 domain-containing protein [Rhodopirellula sp.]|nr:DUF4365 domain-containing protein [Rhodopirellula sp.]